MISYDICSREVLLRELLCYPGLLPAHDILLGKDSAFVPDYENFEKSKKSSFVESYKDMQLYDIL